MCNCIRLDVHESHQAPSTVELETWSSCRLRCSSSRYGRSQQKGCVCQQPCTGRPLVHLCDHDSSHFPVSHRAPLDRLKMFSASVSLRTLHRASGPDTHFVPQTALTRFCSASRTPLSPCPASHISAARPRLVHPPSRHSSRYHFGPNTRPFHCLSCRSLWTGSDFVPKSARFSADVHAPTMTTPRFIYCWSERTFVGRCRMVPTPSRLHVPRAAALPSKSSVGTSSPKNNKTSRINVVSQVADAAA